MRCAGITRISLLVITLAALTVASLAQNQTPVRLSNADVAKMVQAGIPENVIVLEIQVSETNFNIAPDALIGLKHQHVPDGVLAAIVESQASGRVAQSVAPGIVYTAGPSSATHPHRLPNVDATGRIDSKTSGKVEVRANQIKVEKAGVPLFSVKWKDNAAK
jgi:hypothetical protein